VLGVASADGRTFVSDTAPAARAVAGAPGFSTDGRRIWMVVRTADNHLSWTVRAASGRWLAPRRLTSEPVAAGSSVSLARAADGLLTVVSLSPASVVQQHSQAVLPRAGWASSRSTPGPHIGVNP
jgi:hypothetical protein